MLKVNGYELSRQSRTKGLLVTVLLPYKDIYTLSPGLQKKTVSSLISYEP